MTKYTADVEIKGRFPSWIWRVTLVEIPEGRLEAGDPGPPGTEACGVSITRSFARRAALRSLRWWKRYVAGPQDVVDVRWVGAE